MDLGSIIAGIGKAITAMRNVVDWRKSARLAPYTRPFAEMRSVQFPYRDLGGIVIVATHNPLPETVRIRAIGLISPRHGKLRADSWNKWKPPSGIFWLRHGELELHRELPPHKKELLIQFEFDPPKGWNGGRIALSVRFQLTTSGAMHRAIVTTKVGPRP
jgi:hypothetical protein